MADTENNVSTENVDQNVEEPAAKKIKLVDDVDNNGTATEEKDTENGTSNDVSKLEKNIIRQVEYYFGDANLFRDKFLQTEIAKNDGWVPLSTMLTFKRLAELSTDPTVIVDALDKSDEGLIEISEDRQSIRRHPERPLPEKNEETRKECIARTAYVKGFPLELEVADFIEYFEAYPKVANIVVRKYLDKPTKTYKSKGSVFVTFTTREQCAEFLAQEKLAYKDTELIKKWQTDYYADKKTEKIEKQKEKKAKSEPEIELPKGTVIYLEGIDPKVARDSIKATVEELGGEVAFVDFKTGDETGHVRLSAENSAQGIINKLENGKLKIEDTEASARLLKDDEETEYLAQVVEQIKLRRKGHNHGRSRYHHRKRRAADSDE